MSLLNVSEMGRFLEAGKTFSEVKSQAGELSPISKGDKSFIETLKASINKVDEMQKSADVKMQGLSTGENKNIPEVMIAVEQADIAFRLMVQVRNKVIDAYQTIMKMQV